MKRIWLLIPLLALAVVTAPWTIGVKKELRWEHDSVIINSFQMELDGAWTTIDAKRIEDQTYQATLRLRPGVHRIRLRACDTGCSEPTAPMDFKVDWSWLIQ